MKRQRDKKTGEFGTMGREYLPQKAACGADNPIMLRWPPKSTTNFQLILAGHEFTANFLSPHCTKIIYIYAVNSINIKSWWWIKGH